MLDGLRTTPTRFARRPSTSASPRARRAPSSILIRNLPVEKALEVLQFSKRAAAVDVAKVLRSAIANAENNNGLRGNDLSSRLAYVDEGPTLKRIRPRAKGSASRINKRMSHITVIVAPRKEA